jgi:hypothetical protein
MSTSEAMPQRRAVILGLAGLGVCAAAPKGLPNHLFSLTVWASGPTVDFLLLNISEQTLQLVWPAPPSFDVLVRDEEGWILSDRRASPDGFVPAIAPASLTLAEVRRRARRLRSWKSIKGSIPTETLRRLLDGRIREPLTPDRRYALSFRMRVPVLDPAGGMQVATVQSRSLCTWTFAGERLRTDCTGPLLTTESGQ